MTSPARRGTELSPVDVAQRVLAQAAAFDQFLARPSEEMLFQWARALKASGLELADLEQAVQDVYLSSAELPQNRLGAIVAAGARAEKERRRRARRAVEASGAAGVGEIPAGWVGEPVGAAYAQHGAITRRCPTCGADSGDWCRNGSGVLRMPHFNRISRGRVIGQLD